MLPLGETLLLWRAERGLSQAELAAKAGMPRPNLTTLEKGRRDVTLNTLRALASALNVTPGVLADGLPPGQDRCVDLLSRNVLERVADSVVTGKKLADQREQHLAALVEKVTRHRTVAQMGLKGRSKLKRGVRQNDRAWLELRSFYSDEVIDSLIQRVYDKTELHK